MKTINNEESFDSLENKWQVSEIIYDETKDMSDNELINYFQNSIIDSNLNNWWERVKLKDEFILQ